MDKSSKDLRARLAAMAPVRSIPYIQSFQLPHEEELVLIEEEARGKSVQQIALDHNLSVETVWRRRKAALKKISEAQ